MELNVLHRIRERLTVSGFALLMSSVLVCATSAQTVASSDRTLVIGGDVPKPLTLSVAEFKQLPDRVTVVRTEQTGDTKYEGVLVSELLKRAGVTLGQGMGRQTIAAYLLASATDGYQVIFAMGEIDPVFTDSQIIVADVMNGAPLPREQGPFRLIAPHDKGGARSVRLLRRLELVRVQK
jgi:DMSO/TMAO reductase YedYZ molybdopterin-dependent catalytic subunit